MLLPLLQRFKYLLVIGAIIGIAFFAYLKFNSTINHAKEEGYNKAAAEYNAKKLEADKAARAKEAELTEKIEEAQNDAKLRNDKIEDLSNRYTASSNRLLDTIEDLRGKLSSVPRDTANKQADTALSLLGECQARYGEVAEAADRHASDVKLLQDAWPK